MKKKTFTKEEVLKAVNSLPASFDWATLFALIMQILSGLFPAPAPPKTAKASVTCPASCLDEIDALIANQTTLVTGEVAQLQGLIDHRACMNCPDHPQ